MRYKGLHISFSKEQLFVLIFDFFFGGVDALFLNDTQIHTCANTHAHDAHFEHINCCPFRKINAFSKRLYEVRLFPNISPNIPQPKRTSAAKSTYNSL